MLPQVPIAAVQPVQMRSVDRLERVQNFGWRLTLPKAVFGNFESPAAVQLWFGTW